MRNSSRYLAVVFWLSTGSVALADVGPAPSCPAGTHSAYLMGRRCVRNGYHLVVDANHNVVEVADEQPVASPPAVTPPVSEPVKSSQPSKAAACAMGMRADSSSGALLLLAALGLTLLLRRRLTSRASS